MLIPEQELEVIFRKITSKSQFGSISVAILTTYEIDSVCSSQILMVSLFTQNLLKSEDIQFKFSIVYGYKDLDEIKQSITENIKFIFLINCGGLIDLTEYFQSQQTIFLIDYHRPLHHKNIFSPKQIRIVCDDYINIDETLEQEDFDHYFEDNQDESSLELNSSLEEDKENEFDDDVEIGKKRKQKIYEEKKLIKKAKLNKKNLIQNYYHGNFTGQPSAITFYKLALGLSKDNNDNLWLAIIGLTDLFIQNKLSYELYNRFAHLLQSEVSRLNIIEMCQNGTILNENDFRFMLLRHWNLYDSIYYSNYIAAKFGVWWEQGKRQLLSFIAQLGISLEDSHQQYKYLQTSFKKQLKENICRVAPKFDLNDILFNSFTRQISQKLTVSASDMVHLLSAMLSKPETSEKKGENFSEAIKILTQGSQELIENGINAAIEFQKNLMIEAQYLIEKKSIILCSDFRYALIKSDTQIVNQQFQEQKYFSHQISLQKLALILMEIYKFQKQEAKAKPIVLCIQNIEKNIFQVIGVVGAQNQTTNKNNFGDKFAQVAEKNNLKINQDDFETSYIEIDKTDFYTFMEDLIDSK